MTEEDDGEEEKILAENSVQVVKFILHGQSFAIDIYKVLEVQEIPKITSVFHTPDIVVGVVNIRGNIVALVDIGLFFDLGKTELQTQTKMIILEHGDKEAAVIADRMNGVERISENKIQPPPPTVAGVSNRWLQGVVQTADGPLVVLDIEAIFGSEEIEKL